MSIINAPLPLQSTFDDQCSGSVVGSESSLHQISPYIGKIKSSIARYLIENFSKKGNIILDPFCGAGTIPLESWMLGRKVIANDLNRYATVLTLAKLHPPLSLEHCLCQITDYYKAVELKKPEIDLRKTPSWVRSFFHKETLREIIAWFDVLEEKQEWFLISCLLGILHHQRPGFLSFPCSHTVPYLRIKRFPPKEYPDLYEYRSVKDRLMKKVQRTFKRIPSLNYKIERTCFSTDASTFLLNCKIDAVITSPPYMRSLDYARDNRLRLYFLGINDIKMMDKIISPKEVDFIKVMTSCLENWKKALKKNGKCVLFLGDNYSKTYRMHLPEIIQQIAINDIGGYKLIFKHKSIIPENRRVRKHKGNKVETILVFEKVN